MLHTKRKYSNFLITMVTVLVSITVTSCVKEYIEANKISSLAETDVELNVPLAYGNFTARDLLEKFDSKKRVNEYETDKLLYIAFERTVDSKFGFQVVDMEDQLFTNNIPSGDFPSLGALNQIVQKNVSFERDIFTFDRPRRIDSIRLDDAILRTEITTAIKNSAEITIEYPFYKNGQALRHVFTASGNGTVTPSEQNSSLKGYVIKMDNTVSNDTSYIRIKATIKITNKGFPISAADSIIVTTELKSLDFKAMFGYFGRDTILSGDKINIGVDMIEGTENFYFEDPRMHITVQNSYGVPVTIKVDSLRAIMKDLTKIDLTFNPTSENTFSVANPVFAEYGMSKTTVKEFNNSNLIGIRDAANNNPKEILYSVQSISNITNTVNPKQFIMDTSKFDLKVALELPMYGYSKDYTVRDTLNLNMSELYKNKLLKTLNLFFTFENGLPTDIYSQIYMTDSNYVVIDSLYKVAAYTLVESGIVGSNNKVSSITTKKSELSITGSQISKYKNVRFAILKGTMNTFNSPNQSVKFYADYTFNCKISASVKGTLNIDEVEDLTNAIDNLK